MRQSKSERQARIVAELRAAPTLRVYDLAHRLTVSTETVRRDFAELEERGLINRTYGGALRPISLEPAIAEREQLLVEERERIASCAIQLIKDNDILMVGWIVAGSNVSHNQFLKFIRMMKGEVHGRFSSHGMSQNNRISNILLFNKFQQVCRHSFVGMFHIMR